MSTIVTHLASQFIRRQAISCTRRTYSLSAHRKAIELPVRSFHSTIIRNATLASQIESQSTILLASPSPDYLEQEELDVDLPPPEEVKLVISDRAAIQLRSIANKQRNPDAALRIAVESGGCHGYQYRLELATSTSPDDYHFSHPTLQPSNILVDAVSFSLMNGSTIDYSTELIGSSFKIVNNPKAKGSGCGCGVSWELKE